MMMELPNDNATQAEARLTKAARAALEESVELYRRRLLEQAAALETEGPIPAANITPPSQSNIYVSSAARALLDGAMEVRLEASLARRTASLLAAVTTTLVVVAAILLLFFLRSDSKLDAVGVAATAGVVLSSAITLAVSLTSLRQSRRASRRARDAEYALDRFVSTRSLDSTEIPPEKSELANARFLRQWQRLELLVNQLGDRIIDGGSNRPRSLGSTLTDLQVSNALGKDSSDAVRQLLRTRNRVVHGDDDSKFVSASAEDLELVARVIADVSSALEAEVPHSSGLERN